MGLSNTNKFESMSYPTTTMFLNSSNSNSTVSIDNVTTALDEFLPPLLILVGTVCNFFVIKVMRSIYFRFVSTSFFIALTSGLDIFSLLILLTVHWINANFPEIIYRGQGAHIMCKFFNFAGWMTSDLGILLTAGMTTERALAILFPMKASKWCTIKKAKEVCAVIVLIVIIKDFHFLITSDITPKSRRDFLCFVSPTSTFFHVLWTTVWPWLHNGFLCISFIIIIISNCIIISYIRASDKIYNSKLSEIKQSDTKRSTTNQQRGHSKRRQIAIMLLVASFTIILCTLPFSVYTTLELNITFLETNANERSIKHLISSLSFYLLYVNRCVNFFLYCISGTRFRKSLKIILCRGYDKQRTIALDNYDTVSKRSSNSPSSMVYTISRDIRHVRHIESQDTEVITISTRF